MVGIRALSTKYQWIVVFLLLLSGSVFAQSLPDSGTKEPDSTLIILTDIRGIELHQVFYGSGYGNGIQILLVSRYGDVLNYLDSLFCEWGSDLFRPEKLRYDTVNHWFYYVYQSEGTGAYAEVVCIAEMNNGKFRELFQYTRYSSQIYMEINRPYICHEIYMNEMAVSRSQITLKLKYRKGLIVFRRSLPYKRVTGALIYQYNTDVQQFQRVRIKGRRLSRLLQKEPLIC